MVKRISLLLAALGMLLPLAVAAVGLGEIRLSSALNEPLRAEIPLVSVTPDEAEQLSINLAPRERYEAAGIAQVPELRMLRFETVTGSDGSPAIRVSTREAVAEPFLNFLIEVSWPSGRLVREYTLLLDPPALMRGAPPVSQLPEVSEPAAARPPSVSASSIRPATAGEYGPVAEGETLWQIAQAVRPDPGLTIPQVMLALQEANPDAFIRNNINLLKSGVVLRVPDRDAMAALAAEEARSSAQAQAAEWEAYRGQAAEQATPAPRTETPAPVAAGTAAEEPARLELVVPEKSSDTAPSPAPEGAGASGGAAEVAELRRQLDLATEEAEARRLQNEELNAQIQELEEQIAALENLLELNVDEMAAMQQRLQAEEAAEQAAETAEPTEGTEAAAEGGSSAASQEETAQAEPGAEGAAAMQEQAAAGATEPAPEPEPKPAPPPPPPPPPPEPSLFEDPVILGGAAAIVLALIGVIVAKRRKGAGEGGAAPAAEAEPTPSERGGLLARLVGILPGKGKTAEAETVDSEPEAGPAADADEMAALQAAVGESQESPSFEAGEATGQDVLNEFVPEGVGSGTADGDEDPLERADVFMAYGRTDQAEEVLRNLLADQPGHLPAMIKLLEIYSGNQDRASFERQLEDLHEALAGEGGPHWERAVELAQGIAPDHHLVVGQAPAEDDQPTAEEEAALEEAMESDELDMDLDFEPVFGEEGVDDDAEPLDITQEFEGGELGDLSDEGAVDAAVSEAAEKDGGQETDLDLDFDSETSPTDEEPLGEIDFGDEAAQAPAPDEDGSTTDEGMSEDLEKTTELGGLDLEDLDLGSPDESTRPSDTAEPEGGAAEAADDDLDIDLDFGLDEAEPLATQDDEPDKTQESADLDTGSDEESGFDFDVGGDMVETKLELAKTYLDMEDQDSARSILDEVLEEGNEEQQRKAREMLERLSG